MNKSLLICSFCVVSSFPALSEHCPKVDSISVNHNVFTAEAEYGEWIAVIQSPQKQKISLFDYASSPHNGVVYCSYTTAQGGYINMKLEMDRYEFAVDVNPYIDSWEPRPNILGVGYYCGDDASVHNPEDCKFDIIKREESSERFLLTDEEA